MSLLDRTKNVSKESPSSLLGDPDAQAPRSVVDAPLKSDGPSGLLPPENRGSYPNQKPEDLAAVSPSSLLPPVENRNGRRLLVWGGGASAIVLLILVLYVFASREKPVPEVMQEAIAAMNAGRYQDASIHLKNVIRREPGRVDADVLLGKAYLRMGSYLDAEKALRQVKERGGASEDVYAMLVEALLELDRAEDALKELGAASNLSGLGSTSAYLRGRANLGIGNFVDARTQYTILRNTDPPAGMAGLARVLMMEGDVDGARKATSELVAKYPENVDAWMARGDFLRGMGEEKEALDAYRTVQSLRSGHLDAALGIAVILIGQGEFGDAQREIKKARAISPASHRLEFVNALLAFRERRYGDARENLSRILTAAPHHMPSVFLAGALSLEVGDLEQAQNAFVAYLARFPGNLQARKMLALTFLNKKQPQSAVELLAPFVKLDVRDFEFFAIAGQAFLQINDVERALATLKRAATLNPESPDASAHLGLAKLAAGAEREGLAELERAVALGPRDAGPDRHLALAYLARKRFDDVARVADNLERRLPRSPEPHWYRGLVSSARKQPAAARVHHDRALKVAPGYLPAAASLADLDRQEGRTSETRARFESVHRADPRSVEPVLALAKLDGDEGKHQEGVRRLQRAADDHPDNAQIQVLLASFQSRLGRDDDAVQSARRARELNPRDPGALELLGQLQLRTGDSAGAMLSFTTLTGLRPRYMPGWLQLIQAQRIAGERRAALGSAQEAQRISPWEPNLLTLWGDVLLEEKRFPDALKLARLGQEKHPGRAFGYALEGQIRLLEGKPEQALALYREADRREPNGAFRIRIHQAQSAQMGGDAPVDLLKAWIETHPDDSTVQRYTADALVRLGRMDEAVRMYENLLKSSPRDFRLLNNLADALLRKGDVRAMDYAQQAYQIEPTNAVVLTTLGAVLLSRGQLVEAVQSLQKATELDAESQEARLYFAKALIAAGDRVRAKGELQRLVASANQSVHTAEARAILGRL